MKLFKLFQRSEKKLPSQASADEFDQLIAQHQERVSALTAEAEGLRQDRFKNLRKLGLGIGAGIGVGALIFSGVGIVGVVAAGWVFCLAEGLTPVMELGEKVVDGFSKGPSVPLLRAHWALTQAQAEKDKFYPPSKETLGSKLDAQAAVKVAEPQPATAAPVRSTRAMA